MANEFKTVLKSQIDRLLEAKVKQLNEIAQEGHTDWTVESTLARIKEAGLTLAQWWLRYGKNEDLGVVVSIVGEWPEWMPAPLQQGFTVKPVDTRATSQMESGTSIRKQFNSDELEATGSLLLDQGTAAWFERFEKETLDQGTTWFYFPIWVSGTLQTQLVRFKQRPTLSQVNSLHSKYDFVLQVEKRSLMNDFAYWLLSQMSPRQIAKIAKILHEALDKLAFDWLLWCVDFPYHETIHKLARSTWLLPELPRTVLLLAGSTLIFANDESIRNYSICEFFEAKVAQLNAIQYKGRSNWTFDLLVKEIHDRGLTVDRWWWKYGVDEDLDAIYSIYVKLWPEWMNDPLHLVAFEGDLDRADSAIWKLAGSTWIPENTPWNRLS